MNGGPALHVEAWTKRYSFLLVAALGTLITCPLVRCAWNAPSSVNVATTTTCMRETPLKCTEWWGAKRHVNGATGGQMHCDLAELLDDEERQKVVAELVRELRKSVPDYLSNGNRWAKAVSKRRAPKR